MDPRPPHDDPVHQVIHLAFLIAAETGERCRPVHLLAALARTEGAIADALRPPGGGPLFPHASDRQRLRGGGAGYLCLQTQEAARDLAIQRAEREAPEHLFLAVIDQAEPEAIGILVGVGLDLAALRNVALGMLGAPPDLAPISMPHLTGHPPAGAWLTPAGTMDRPALPVGELDPRAWAALCWRQNHLPLRRVRARSTYEALRHLESQAAWRLASRLQLDDDQRHSLSRHHIERLEHLVGAANPALVEHPRSSGTGFPVGLMITTPSRWWRRHGIRWLCFFSGWGTWCRNRQVNLRNRWFRLRTVPYYRGAPEL